MNEPEDRIWGALMENGVIRAVVLDTTRQEAVEMFGHDGDGIRAWRISMLPIEPGEDDEDDDCDGPERCYPGHPCPKCQITAPRYWFKVEEGKKKRTYHPYSEVAIQGPRKVLRDDCPHRKGHPDEASARRCAKRHGKPFIEVMDGNWKHLETIPANGQPSLFGDP